MRVQRIGQSASIEVDRIGAVASDLGRPHDDTRPVRATGTLIAALVALAGCGDGAPDSSDSPPPGATRVLSNLPPEVDPGQRYLIYLHNLWLENHDENAEHPTFGPYQFREILDEFADRAFTVIAEVRPRGSQPNVYAERVALQVRSLIDGGVPPDQITVVGFSKGGVIAILTASALEIDGVNFVFLAACGGWVESRSDLQPRGRLLSVREASDEWVSSCDALFGNAPSSAVARELVLHLGGGHGAFFRPHPDWIEPVTSWAMGRDLED